MGWSHHVQLPQTTLCPLISSPRGCKYLKEERRREGKESRREEKRGEKRRGEERRRGEEKRGEKRRERGERGDRKEEEGERGDRKEEEGEERREEREEIHEERGERRKERGERRGDRMTLDLSFLIGVARGLSLSLRCMCHVAAFGFVDPIMYVFSYKSGHKQNESDTPERGGYRHHSMPRTLLKHHFMRFYPHESGSQPRQQETPTGAQHRQQRIQAPQRSSPEVIFAPC